jgi:hypothetical protein
MRRITEKEINNLLKLDYDSFLETIVAQLIILCSEQNSMKELLDSLDTDIREDVLRVLRSSKLNSILDERS